MLVEKKFLVEYLSTDLPSTKLLYMISLKLHSTISVEYVSQTPNCIEFDFILSCSIQKIPVEFAFVSS